VALSLLCSTVLDEFGILFIRAQRVWNFVQLCSTSFVFCSSVLNVFGILFTLARGPGMVLYDWKQLALAFFKICTTKIE
jgi:hypothetical protein